MGWVAEEVGGGEEEEVVDEDKDNHLDQDVETLAVVVASVYYPMTSRSVL